MDYTIYPVEDVLWSTCISCGGYPVDYTIYPVDYATYPVEDMLWTTLYILWRISCGVLVYPVENVGLSCGSHNS